MMKARFIIEILGKPKEYVENVLRDLVAKIEAEKGLVFLNKNVHEAKKMEDKELFTSFAEIESQFDSFEDLLRVMFTYMPSNIEITEPFDFRLKCHEVNDLLNLLAAKLHQYDSVAKALNFQNQAMQKQLQEIFAKRIKVKEIKPAGKAKRKLKSRK